MWQEASGATRYRVSLAPANHKREVDKPLAEQLLDVEKETWQECVRNLLEKQYILCLSLEDYAHNPEHFLQSVGEGARVHKLLQVAAAGTDAEKRALVSAIVHMCRVYIDDLPDSGPPDEPWTPTVMSPGSAAAYPYLLRHLDADGSTLKVVVQMFSREQDALRKHYGITSPDYRSMSEMAMLCAYACDHFLGLYASRDDLRRAANPAQVAVLDAFRRYQEQNGNRGGDWFSYDFQVLGFARQFVDAGSVAEPTRTNASKPAGAPQATGPAPAPTEKPKEATTASAPPSSRAGGRLDEEL
jgi:hypothetical protein